MCLVHYDSWLHRKSEHDRCIMKFLQVWKLIISCKVLNSWSAAQHHEHLSGVAPQKSLFVMITTLTYTHTAHMNVRGPLRDVTESVICHISFGMALCVVSSAMTHHAPDWLRCCLQRSRSPYIELCLYVHVSIHVCVKCASHVFLKIRVIVKKGQTPCTGTERSVRKFVFQHTYTHAGTCTPNAVVELLPPRNSRL